MILLDTVAFAQVPSDATLRIQITSLSKTNISVTISNTQAEVLYELQYKQNRTNWISLGFDNGSEMTNETWFVIWMPTNYTANSPTPITAKSFRVRSFKDSYAGGKGGMADWWQIKYFGNIGVDGFADPMGDGWLTMTKWQKGMDPFKWYTPPAPQSQFPYSNPPHYQEPLPYAQLNEITATSISNRILSVTAKKQTNGYVLTVHHPIIHARYLLLVRDTLDAQWRASGYFVSGTNRNSVQLHVDTKGMMTDPQAPITLQAVQFLPDVVQPQFTAGWGEDTDGDGLPDIYEVLVTRTDPDDADTGDTGIPDGYRVFSDDGWNNWDKFHYRANPFKKCEPPPVVVLEKPTASEIFEAQLSKTDLPYEPELEIRTNSEASFQPYSLSVDRYLPPDNRSHARGDVRIVWKVPPPSP
jgi:hypothetical protein